MTETRNKAAFALCVAGLVAATGGFAVYQLSRMLFSGKLWGVAIVGGSGSSQSSCEALPPQ